MISRPIVSTGVESFLTGAAGGGVGWAGVTTGEDEGAAAGVGAGAGTVAVGVLEGVDEVNGDVGAAEGWEPEVIDPSPRFIRLAGATFPLKNSDAESEGSRDGAGGKMSDWKPSACRG